MEEKKGTGLNPAPKKNDNNSNRVNVNRLRAMCQFLMIIATIGIVVTYTKQTVNMLYMWAGVMLATAIMMIMLYPIKEDEDE